jgi:hypothetical protein
LGLRLARDLTRTTRTHESYRPSDARSCEPVTRTRPREQITSALTIRGDAPRSRTFSLRNEPRQRLPKRAVTPRRDSGPMRQRWRGEILSYGSLTPLRYGTGSPPQTFSMFSVWPPEVEKK